MYRFLQTLDFLLDFCLVIAMPRVRADYKFRDEWLLYDRYKDWPAKDRDLKLARCKVCMKSVNIANSGKYALGSHTKADSQKEMKSVTISRTSFRGDRGQVEQNIHFGLQLSNKEQQKHFF